MEQASKTKLDIYVNNQCWVVNNVFELKDQFSKIRIRLKIDGTIWLSKV